MGWKAPQLIEYAAKLKTDSLFISDLDAVGSLEEKALGELKAKAADHGFSSALSAPRFNAALRWLSTRR